jgi:hypothetical protein
MAARQWRWPDGESGELGLDLDEYGRGGGWIEKNPNRRRKVIRGSDPLGTH